MLAVIVRERLAGAGCWPVRGLDSGSQQHVTGLHDQLGAMAHVPPRLRLPQQSQTDLSGHDDPRRIALLPADPQQVRKLGG